MKVKDSSWSGGVLICLFCIFLGVNSLVIVEKLSGNLRQSDYHFGRVIDSKSNYQIHFGRRASDFGAMDIDIDNFKPLHRLRFLKFYRPQSSLGCASGFYRLPDNCTKRKDDGPRNDSFGPCYEFVPPLRLLLAVVCLACAVAINAYRSGRIRLLCVLPIVGSGWLILSGHKYWCEGDQREYEYDPSFHGANNVTQKYLTSGIYCNTVIGMANVLPKDKQIAVIGALAEGSSIRSIERLTGIHRDTIMRLGVRAVQRLRTAHGFQDAGLAMPLFADG